MTMICIYVGIAIAVFALIAFVIGPDLSRYLRMRSM
jgi:hypothetical protein